MRLIEIRIDGFGRLRGRTFAFDPRLTVVHGPNEAGKSTLAAAIVAALYGTGRKRDAWRPWDGGQYRALLRYELSSGREYEVARDFEDTRGVSVRNRDGEDVSANLVDGKHVSPGAVHLGIPLEVFLNAGCVRQGEVQIEDGSSDAIGAALARALDGGPKEDAAIGALQRLERGIAQHVGTKRATVNVPLKKLAERAAAATARLEAAQERLRLQAALRRSLDAQRAQLERRTNEQRTLEGRIRSARAGALRVRLDSLREIRNDLSSAQAQRAEYDDVATFAGERLRELESRFTRWQEREAVAGDAAREETAAHMRPSERAELDERLADAGALDDEAFARVQADSKKAQNARDVAVFAAEALAAARRTQGDGDTLTGAAAMAGALLGAGAVTLAIAHAWWPAGGLAVLAVLAAVFAVVRLNRRRAAVAVARDRQSQLDTATASESNAARAVADVLERVGVPTFDELAERRRRLRELLSRRETASAAARRRDEARTRAHAAAAAFDELAAALLPAPSGDRAADLAEGRRLAARRTAREGVELQLGMLNVRRSDVLGNDDEVSLERELAELLAAGTIPAAPDGTSLRTLESEGADLLRRLREAEAEVTNSAAELRALEGSGDDVAALDEEAQGLHAEVARLERFERAVSLARKTIEERMHEAHEKFARRLADYASNTFAGVTGGRYTDLRIAPASLEITVRVPETGDVRELKDLSSGTREQAYLIVRLAMARMFAEGTEVLPLLLDDPFVSWDSARIERGLPILNAATRESQVIIFTASDALAAAAAAQGAALIDLADGLAIRAEQAVLRV